MSETQTQTNGPPRMDDDFDETRDIIEAGALESITRGEIDIQVRTAKMYPRNIRAAKDKAKSMVLFDAETAESCIYALERRGKSGTTYINGPSVRMAEIIAISWGNLRISARIIGDNGRMVTAQGVCHDLENNVAILKDTKRRVTTSAGKRYNEDMVMMTMNAASSIAVRNAIFSCIPKAAWKPIYEAAAALANGGGRPFGDVRAEWVTMFEKAKISPERYLAVVDRTSTDDLTMDDLVTFRGIQNKAKEEGQPFASYFPVPQSDAPTPTPAPKRAPAASPASPASDVVDQTVPDDPIPSPVAPQANNRRPARQTAKTLDDFAQG